MRSGRLPSCNPVYRHWFYWLAVLICGFGASAITWALADWTPDAGLLGQTFSILCPAGLLPTRRHPALVFPIGPRRLLS